MIIVVIPTVLLWILAALVVLNLGATICNLHLMRRMQCEKPWLAD